MADAAVHMLETPYTVRRCGIVVLCLCCYACIGGSQLVFVAGVAEAAVHMLETPYTERRCGVVVYVSVVTHVAWQPCVCLCSERTWRC
jgi:hypothetical protein